MPNIRLLIIFLFFILFTTACSNDTQQESLLQSIGRPTEILVVMDSTEWKGEIGTMLKKIWQAEIPNLPKAESYFSLKYVSPLKFKGLLKRYRNIIFVTNFDSQSAENNRLKNNFKKDLIDKIKADPKLYMFVRHNEYAANQETLHLFGATREQLLKNLENNEDKLLSYFQNVERKRFIENVKHKKITQELIQTVENKYPFSIQPTDGFEIAKQDKDFLWLRRMGDKIDANITITSTKYTSEAIFKDSNMVAWRDSTGIKFLNDSTLKNSYMSTEKSIPLYSQRILINNNYTALYRGLWKLKNNSRGGPFISYMFVNTKTNLIYYVEGFLYAPGENKREAMLELDAILRTFESKNKI